MTNDIAQDALTERLKQQTVVNDPFLGATTAARMEADSMLWPGDRWSRIEQRHVTEAEGRRFEEYRFTSADGRYNELPVAFMFAPAAGGGLEVRVYSDHHLVEDRADILPVQEGLHPWRSEDDVLYRYFQAINGNHLEDVLDLFDDGGYFTHSNGETFNDREGLRGDFTKMMGGVGIRIKYCLVTDDGTVCAVETYMPSGRPAVATYERGRPGRLKAVRIYL